MIIRSPMVAIRFLLASILTIYSIRSIAVKRGRSQSNQQRGCAEQPPASESEDEDQDHEDPCPSCPEEEEHCELVSGINEAPTARRIADEHAFGRPRTPTPWVPGASLTEDARWPRPLTPGASGQPLSRTEQRQLRDKIHILVNQVPPEKMIRVYFGLQRELLCSGISQSGSCGSAQPFTPVGHHIVIPHTPRGLGRAPRPLIHDISGFSPMPKPLPQPFTAQGPPVIGHPQLSIIPQAPPVTGRTQSSIPQVPPDTGHQDLDPEHDKDPK